MVLTLWGVNICQLCLFLRTQALPWREAGGAARAVRALGRLSAVQAKRDAAWAVRAMLLRQHQADARDTCEQGLGLGGTEG